MQNRLIALPLMLLLLLTAACANSPKEKLVTEIRVEKVKPPASLMACPTPKLHACGLVQECIAEDFVALGEAWSICAGNMTVLRKWAAE